MSQTPSDAATVPYAASQHVDPAMVDDQPALDSLARASLRAVAWRDGRVVVGEVREVARHKGVFVASSEPDGTPGLTLVEMGGPLDTSGKTEPDVYLIVWEADTVRPPGDPDPTDGYVTADGLVRANLSDQQRHNGGTVIFKHGLPDAHVRAYGTDDKPIGYLFGVEVDTGEHQVQVLPGTAYLIAAPDSDESETSP